ncbi:MAG TPA: selenium-dependent molybdenum cofactor biosynthesis protein YqeB [Bacillota bacterium]|jgi:xanthine dehydrogenase accessory factor
MSSRESNRPGDFPSLGPVLILGAGDLATGVAYRLYRAGFPIFMTELPEPLAVRRTVAFSECVFRGSVVVEGVKAVRVESAEEALWTTRAPGMNGVIPVIVDPEGAAQQAIGAPVMIDARMSKRKNLGTTITDAQVVIGLGPGFEAGVDCHAVVETARGHYLGQVIYHGSAQRFNGQPGSVRGHSLERVLRAPQDGIFRTFVELGSRVEADQVVAMVAPPEAAIAMVAGAAPIPIHAAISGIVRGLLREGAPVKEEQKVGDIDPRFDPEALNYISDKARAVAGGALEAVTCLLWGRPPA